MPRLSLYRPQKGNDYKFIDRTASEMFQVGGTDLYLHKYLGPENPSDENATADQPQYDAVKETNIQDLLLLENRDRKYDPSIYKLRGVYNVADLDFNLSQFGLFIDNDVVYMTVHINDFIRSVGRKPLSGDVIELPHVKDEFALNDFDVSLPRYFVISDVGRAAEGFSPTWYPHLYRLKLTKIMDSQQYKDIFDQKVVDPVTGEETDTTLSDILSTYNKSIEINDAVIAQADADTNTAYNGTGMPEGKSGYETRQFYTLTVDQYGKPLLKTADETDIDASNNAFDVSRIAERPKRTGYQGYLVGDGVPDNGVEFGHGVTFPENPYDGDFWLRTDFFPNRLFRYDGTRWVKYEDAVRHTLTNTDTRQTQKTSFINNDNATGVNMIASEVVKMSSTTNEIQTTHPFVTGMYATGIIGESVVRLEVTSGNGGLAKVTFPETINIGAQVQWKLYTASIKQRVAISKAIKPRADL
jgi:hypothetical protein